MSKRKHRKPKILSGLLIIAVIALLMAACQRASEDIVSLNLESDPFGSAELIGSGQYPQGKEVTVRAIPALGWEFVNWTLDGQMVAETQDYTFIVQGQTSLMANFRPRQYAIAALAQGQGNVVYPNGQANHGEEVVVKAVPASGYRFLHWSENGDVVSISADYVFTADANRNLTAVFLPVINVEVQGKGGQVEETWSFESGPEVTLKAITPTGYEFFGWVDMDKDQEVSVDAVYTFTWDGPKKILARFRELLIPVDGNSIVAVVGKKTTLGNYKPDDLVELPPHISLGSEPRRVRQEVAEHLILLADAAKAKGVTVRVRSGYRSYETQQRLFFDYARSRGVLLAETFSARPGQSEHQLGTAVDFGGTAVDWKPEFGRTEQGRWLFENAHKYGFALSYPENSIAITGYVYEPWHYRYIGVELAMEWKESGLALIEFLKTKN